MTLEYAEKRVRALLSEVGDNEIKIMPLEFCDQPTYTSLDEPLVQIVKKNATKITGKEPIYFIGMGGTDGRIYRERGIPAVIYGPRPFNMGGIDEHILIEDYLNVIKVQACSIIEFLGVN